MNIAWAGTYAATKVLMERAPFFLVTSLRYLAAAAPLLLVAWRISGLRMSARDFARAALMGIATFTLCPLFLYAGVSLSRAGDAAVLVSTEPLLVSIGAFVFLREKIDRPTGAALAAAFAGAVILSGFWLETGAVHPFGTALIVLGIFFEASYSVMGKELLRRHPPLRVTAVALAAACVVNAVAVTLFVGWAPAARLTAGDGLILVGYLAGLCTVVGYTYWYVALRDAATSRVTLTIFAQPVVGLAAAYFLNRESPTAHQIAGAAIILAAVAATLRRVPAVPIPPEAA